MSDRDHRHPPPALRAGPALPPRLLLHLVPSFLGKWRQAVELVDLTIEPIGLRLTSGRDLATRRPFPNKRWAVVCRPRGRSAMNGILIDTDWPDGDLVATARWSVDAERIVERIVRYRLLDCMFDAASEWHMHWHACSSGLGGWSNRWPNGGCKTAGSFFFEPHMETHALESSGNQASRAYEQVRRRHVRDTLAADGYIIAREEVCPLPTLERRRFMSP